MILDKQTRAERKIKRLEQRIADIQHDLSVWGFSYTPAYKERKINKVATLHKRVEQLRGIRK